MAALSTPKELYETLVPEQMTRMLANGADPNAKDQFGYNALMWAASSGSAERAKLLVAGKADVNAQRDGGSTALMRAARNGKCDIAKLLIDNKADTKITNSRGVSQRTRQSNAIKSNAINNRPTLPVRG